MKVVSLLPSATELVCAAGGEGFLVGRSHECDYPPSIRDRPILTAAKNKFESMSQMNDAVTASLGAGEGLYTVDQELLLRLNPDVIVTQSLCEVCSVDLALVERICAKALPSANIISLNPFTIEEVLEDVLRVGTAMQQEAAAQAAVADMQRRIDTAKAFVASQPPLKLNNVSGGSRGGQQSSVIFLAPGPLQHLSSQSSCGVAVGTQLVPDIAPPLDSPSAACKACICELPQYGHAKCSEPGLALMLRWWCAHCSSDQQQLLLLPAGKQHVQASSG